MTSKTTARKPQQQQQRRDAPSTAVATRDARAGALSKLNFGDVGPKAGMEDADRASFAIPFLLILQTLSPQLDKNDKQNRYIKGAKEGDFLNSATLETYDGAEGVIVLPVDFKRSFVQWGLREKGGGYKGEYAPSDAIVATTTVDGKNRNVLPDGATQLVDTRLHGVILLHGDTPMPALINLTSTQIKKSKRWMTQMNELQSKDLLPTFAHAYKITTVPESNDQGRWYGVNIEKLGDVEEQEHVDAALAFYKALRAGGAKMQGGAAAEGQ